MKHWTWEQVCTSLTTNFPKITQLNHLDSCEIMRPKKSWKKQTKSQITYIYIYLEPVCPLFLGETTLQKKAQTPIKTRGPIWVPGIYIYIYFFFFPKKAPKCAAFMVCILFWIPNLTSKEHTQTDFLRKSWKIRRWWRRPWLRLEMDRKQKWWKRWRRIRKWCWSD